MSVPFPSVLAGVVFVPSPSVVDEGAVGMMSFPSPSVARPLAETLSGVPPRSPLHFTPVARRIAQLVMVHTELCDSPTPSARRAGCLDSGKRSSRSDGRRHTC